MKNIFLVAAVIVLGAFQPQDDLNTLRDPRDGKVYKTVTIGNQVWMAQNINYNVPESHLSNCYKNSAGNCEKFGRLYDWVTAIKACPDGWHLPSKEEWEQLIANYPDNETAYKNLISDGASGFNATLHGVYAIAENQFLYMKEYGAYWTSSDYNTDRAWAQRFLENTSDTYQSQATKINGQACRCVKN